MEYLEFIIAKYYLPNELFIGQVEEIMNLLIEKFAKRLTFVQAVDKAAHFLEEYYFL
jgi:hypothetical protein